MKRKVAKVSTFRLSPNEEASILKQERERRRKMRLQQVREQEKFIAQHIRQDVKERRDQQLQQLAEDLRSKWEVTQAEKLQALEKIYLCTLNAIGEGHRQAKENEPDLKAIEKTVAINKEKAEERHREALKELKQHKEKELRTQSWHIKARKKALDIEKERAAKIASLPPPPPDPLQSIEVAQRLPLVKVCNVESFSASRYHLPEAYVDREMDTEQTDACSAAVQEEKRLNALQLEEERDRREQVEKANLRGSHALKMVQLAQDRERLMKELEHMQQGDLSRRRQIVAKMPQQLFEPAYRRAEIQEEWQRELETAFEDMYTRNAKMRGDMVLHLKPQPLPDPSVTSVDEDLDLTAEPEVVSGVERHLGGTEDISVEEHQEAREPQSKQVLKRLLNRIRTQKDQWIAKADTIDAVSDTLESGSLPINHKSEDNIQEEEDQSEVGGSNEVTDSTVLAGKSIPLRPQEQTVRIRMEAERKKKMEELERQKQEQLELLSKLEEERRSLEAECHKIRLQVPESSGAVQKDKPEPAVVDGEPEESTATVTQLNTSAESLHIQMIREYQQRLIDQNRVHQQSVDDARKRLQEYQLLLKNRYPHLSTANVEISDRSQECTRTPQGPQPNSPEKSNPGAVVSSLPYPNAFEIDLALSRMGIPSTGQQTLDRSRSQSLVRSGLVSPSSGRDFHAVDSFKLRAESPVGVDTSGHHFLGARSPQGLLSHSLNEDQGRPQDTIIGSEKLSSTSSPGDHDSSSATSYLPLPSTLSLGLPQIDFSEPSLSFTVPEDQVSKRDHLPLGDFSNVQEFRERLLSSAADICNQQDHLKEMQVQLDQQRESLQSKQKCQEQRLLHKQKDLEEQIRRHQESLGNLLGSTEPRAVASPADLRMIPERERYRFMSALLKALDDHEDGVSMATNFESSNDSLMRPPGREQKWRPSKPPVTKTKLGHFLEQHELSAIMEVETPNSGRPSSTGFSDLKDSQPGRHDRSGHHEPVDYHPDVGKMSSDSTLIPGEDLSRLSASIRDETSNQSHSKLSWRETLSLQVSRNSTGGDRSVTPVLHRSLHEILTSNRDSFHKYHSMDEGTSGLGPTGQERSPNSVSDYLSTTTISSGSFLTSEKTESSPVSSDIVSDLQRCNYSAIDENKGRSSSPSGASTAIPLPTTWSHYLSPVENQNHIQQIIDKYTKDLSASLERNLNFYSPEVATDISTSNNQLSTTFHSLDPKPDFNISTPSSAQSGDASGSQNMRELSQSSSYSSRPERQTYRSPASHPPHGTPAMSSSTGSIHSLNVRRRSPGRQNEADSSGSFLPLHPECTLNVSCHQEPSCGVSGQEQDKENPLQHGVSLSLSFNVFHEHDAGRRPFTSQDSSTILTNGAGESGSFRELLATQMTENDSELSEHPISENLERNSLKNIPFEELPAIYEDRHGKVNPDQDNPDNREDEAASMSSDQTPRSENLTRTSSSKSSLQSSSSLTTGSSAGSLLSFLHTWDSESMRGILEEPDLTLISLNDSSIVCSEPQVTPTSISDHQDESTSQNAFRPLEPEVDASGLQAPEQSSVDLSLSRHFAEMSLEFTSTPGNLQDAFLKKKRHFIETSSKRVQEIKTKDRVPKQKAPISNLKDVSAIQGDQQPRYELFPSDGGQLKKVVEVRVCTPEDCRLSELERHQRTIRLYNQLDEVKTRREEKMRHENYAKNREKAKEFKKKTLEKLRAKR
ncbi:centrosomal protein of 295 kDa isoform X2 [Rhinoderma darwinii]|uniref:centrosomal protein of 295 kDa isoform X2 n=1 Tax=Rhinoderma darwinii TaxID=43563 RepID=UPI003F661C4D